jgi:hypothetical protein
MFVCFSTLLTLNLQQRNYFMIQVDLLYRGHLADGSLKWMMLLAEVSVFRDYDYKPSLGDERISFLEHETFAVPGISLFEGKASPFFS